MEYPRITVHTSGELVQKSRTETDDDELMPSVFMGQKETIGELNLSIGMGTRKREETLSDEQLHKLFIESESYKFGGALLQVHPEVDEFLEKEFDIDSVEDVSFTVEDDSMLGLNGDEERKLNTVMKAANTTDNPRQTLLEYATMNSQFQDLPFYAEKLLVAELEGQDSDLELIESEENEEEE